MSNVQGPRFRTRWAVGSPGPARWWTKAARHRYAIRFPLADVIDDGKAIAAHYVVTSPYRAPRWLWQQRDHDLAPVVAVVLAFPVLLWVLAIFPFPPFPRAYEYVLAGAVALGLALWVAEPHPAAATARAVRNMQRDLDARINGLKVEAVIDRPHAITAVCSVARGLDPEQYETQKGQLASSFRAPVAITRDSPGRLELRIQRQDLLAREAHWRPQTEPDPFHVPLGHDWDGGDVDWPVPGHAMLVAGERGGGKSSLMNAQIAHIAAIPNTELRICDPLEGVDLATWWELAETVGDTPELAWKVLTEAHQLWRERLVEMRQAGVEKATWPRWSLRVLVIDELSALTYSSRLPRQQRLDNLSALEDLLTKGRKTLDVVIAATQFPTAEVIPTLIRGQFTRRVGFRVEESAQTNVILGGGTLGRGIDLAAIPEEHKGRGYLKSGSSIVGLRAVGLWGKKAKAVARRLAERRADDLPERCHLATSDPATVDISGRIEVVPQELPFSASERVRMALPDNGEGVSVGWLVEQTGLAERTIRYHLSRQPWAVKVSHGRYRRRP
jgi:S-DNA-T family DNA segregation ATPase FtsK/SpoIIIE